MQAELELKKELAERLHFISEVNNLDPNELLNECIEKYLDSDELEDRIFEERTRRALERVEKRGVKGKPASEFLKEMESW